MILQISEFGTFVVQYCIFFLMLSMTKASYCYFITGYGVSSGKPSEKNLYSDIQAAWDALRTRYGISPENIILYGQSIGELDNGCIAMVLLSCEL